MALRNRNTARPRDDAPGLRDVALGPTIYGGERYSKMSERLKRQHRKPGDVAASSTRVGRSLILAATCCRASLTLPHYVCLCVDCDSCWRRS